jgi:acyl carrier protein
MNHEPTSEAITAIRRSREDIEHWLTSKFAEIAELARAQIDLDEPLERYRFDSSVAVSVTGDLSSWLGRELPVTLFWEHPTIRALVSALAAG